MLINTPYNFVHTLFYSLKVRIFHSMLIFLKFLYPHKVFNFMAYLWALDEHREY